MLRVILSLLFLTTGALAQELPMSHPMPGVKDPYPVECCSGKDCSPWPVDDVQPDKGGGYFIPSLNLHIPRSKVKSVTKAMLDYAMAKNGEPTPYHLCIRRTMDNQLSLGPDGLPYVFCFFAAEGF